MSVTASEECGGFKQASVGRWLPIVGGGLRLAAEIALRDIARAMPVPGTVGDNATLAGGEAGFALFRAYFSRWERLSEEQRNDQCELAMGHLQVAVDYLASAAQAPDLFSGLTGVAWTVNHLATLGVVDDSEELCKAADDALIDYLDGHAGTLRCELVAGLSGIGLYGLGRWHRPAGRKIVARVVTALEDGATEHQGRRTWFYPPALLSPQALLAHPDGCYNLGLSHGVPGALVFLAGATARDVPAARELLTEGTEWLFRQQRMYRNGSKFGYSFRDDPEQEPGGSRLAWCYGDLGVSAAILLCARTVRRRDWEIAVLDLARGAAVRRIQDSDVVDAGLCHGAFGNAHLFGRLYTATREQCFVRAARGWIRAGLAMRHDGGDNAGFRAWSPPLPGEPSRDPWRASKGLVEGICGIGLAMLGFLSPLEPAWDELFMVNIPPMDG
jgi:lantibiotic biosynthesis protein